MDFIEFEKYSRKWCSNIKTYINTSINRVKLISNYGLHCKPCNYYYIINARVELAGIMFNNDKGPKYRK